MGRALGEDRGDPGARDVTEVLLVSVAAGSEVRLTGQSKTCLHSDWRGPQGPLRDLTASALPLCSGPGLGEPGPVWGDDREDDG